MKARLCYIVAFTHSGEKKKSFDSKLRGQIDETILPSSLYLLQSLHYADLDHSVLGRHRRMSTVVSGDASTVYAVVV
jgi:hypothetical protein